MIKFSGLPFYLKLACTLISILVLGYIAKIGDTILVPFILGLLLALLLVPISNFFESKLKLPRTIAGILTVLLFFGLVGFGFYMLASQLSMIKDDWPAFKEQILAGFHNVQIWVTDRFGVMHSEQMDIINKTATKSLDSGTLLLGTALLSLSSLFILLVFTFLYTFFLLIYRSHIVKFLLMLNDKEHHTIVLDVVGQVQYVVKKYLIGLLLQMLIVSALVFAALSIIGVKYSLLLAIITGVFNVLPYIGIFTAMLVIALLTFATTSFTHVLIVTGALIVIHVIDSNFIVPKIVGSKVKVNSLFAMMAIIVGELIWGISGMFLAIPILAICKIIMDRIKELKPWGFLLGEEDSKNKV